MPAFSVTLSAVPLLERDETLAAVSFLGCACGMVFAVSLGHDDACVLPLSGGAWVSFSEEEEEEMGMGVAVAALPALLG